MDQGERRPGKGVERAHGERGAARERHVVLERVACDLAQPGKIGAGLEVLAVRPQDQQAHAAIGGERAHRLAQRLDQRAVVGVVHFGPVERERGDPARVDRDQHQGLGHVDLPTGNRRSAAARLSVLTTIAGRVQPAQAGYRVYGANRPTGGT